MSAVHRQGRPPHSFLLRTAVVIPAFNEESCVRFTVHYWRGRGVKRVRVVDNGSHDATGQRAVEARAEVLHEPARGYGAAAWRGCQQLPPGIEWILFSAADGSDRLQPAEAAAFDEAIRTGADLILGERVSQAESRVHLRRAQKLGNWLCCAVIELGWGRRFADMGSLRVIRRSALERLALRDRSFGWNIEMQVRALEEGLSIVELPVRYHPRLAGEPKISGSVRGTLRAGRVMLLTLCKLYQRRTVPPPAKCTEKERERQILNRWGCC